MKATPKKDSEQYKELVGLIIGGFTVAKRIRYTPKNHTRILRERKEKGRKLYYKIRSFAKAGDFPRLDAARQRLHEAIK